MKVLIFGNSGSGKTTKARQLKSEHGLAHLDLDTLAWLSTAPPKRKPLEDSAQQIKDFIDANENWVIEGCYSDLLGLVLSQSSEIIFLDIGIEACIENAKQRPWEPHKYPSKEAQDAKLSFLIGWISLYEHRDDVFSRRAHEQLFKQFEGKKTRIR